MKRIYTFDGFEVDTINRQLRRGNKYLSLPAKSFDVLVALLENNGRLVSKDEIFSRVWHDQIVEESNLTVHISQIRKALGESKKNPLYIITIPGFGYRFDGEVSALDDEFIFETETLSRVTIEKELTESENHLFPDSTPVDAALDSSLRNAEPLFPRFTLLIKLGAAAAFGVLLVAGGTFWLSARSQSGKAVVQVSPFKNETRIKRLTSKGNVSYGAISPDGKFFAYSVRERGAYRSSLFYGQTNGNSDIPLLPTADVTYNPRSFSADGNWIYYTVSEPRGFDNGSLYKIPVLGGVPPQKLLNDISVYAVLSPDEKQVAFIRRNQENKTSALLVSNLDGSGEREVIVRPVGQSFLSFSLSWSNDGAMVAFGAESGKDRSYEIFAVNIADRKVKQITDLGWVTISSIAWNRDDTKLLISARDINSFSANQIWQVELNSGKAEQITRDLQHYASTLSLSTDSNALLTIQVTRESNIWIASSNNIAAARQVTFGSSGSEGWFGIDWTPTGGIIYTARTDQGLTLWKMDVDGSNARQLTSAGFLDERPSVTADGKYVIFQSNRSGSTQIWRMNADGEDLRQLTYDGRNSFPHSTPDGRSVVYTRTADGVNAAWKISIDGGDPSQIANTDCYNARVSPDGNLIACGYRSDEKTKLAIIEMVSGEPKFFFDLPPTYNFDGSIRWERDGKSVAYRDWANGVWSQSLDGGDPKRLNGLPAEKLYHFDWSLDGRQFAFVRGSEVRDAVLLSNLINDLAASSH